jgi:hypothetical protein
VRSRSKSDAGQATVEFALLVPLFIIVVTSLFDVLSIVRDQLAVDLIARDAARYASEATNADDAESRVWEVVGRSGRDDLQWHLRVGRDHLLVHVRMTPSLSVIGTSLQWFSGARHVWGSATFSSEFELRDD